VRSSTFSELTVEDLCCLTVDELAAIVSSDSLEIESEDVLLQKIMEVAELQDQTTALTYWSLLRFVRFEYLSSVAISAFVDRFPAGNLTEDVWKALGIRLKYVFLGTNGLKRGLEFDGQFRSRIAPNGLPAILEEFRHKRFRLLYRASEDGFLASSFHRRCDGHGNTLTFIRDTHGNEFGGYTPVEWESRDWYSNLSREDSSNCWKCDPSKKSFLFTLKNPHNVSPRYFPLKPQKEQLAICCHYLNGPHFDADLVIADNCNRPFSHTSSFGASYTNDTNLAGKTFLTGSEKFSVDDIEVFEMND
jgi:hypothetical protein